MVISYKAYYKKLVGRFSIMEIPSEAIVKKINKLSEWNQIRNKE